MERKYELTDETKEIDGRILHRIVAVKDFCYGDRISIVRKGGLGGFIESEDNLSHNGGSWVMNHSCVYENAHIVGNALVGGCAHVHGTSLVKENAYVHGYANIYEDSIIRGNAHVYDDVNIHGDANISGNASINGNAHVHGYAIIRGDAHICENADIASNEDYAVVSGFGSENRTTTFFLSASKKILVSCGCFIGYLDEFRNRVKKTYEGRAFGIEYLMIADLMEMRFERVLENK